MKVEFLSIAEAELVEAVSYYNGQSEGLGYEFAVEVRQTISRILRFPDAWTRLSVHTRRCRTKRFPYGVVYQIRGDFGSYYCRNAFAAPPRYMEIATWVRKVMINSV